MIQKLRRKFILINMLLVSVVLVVVLAFLMGSTSQRLRDQSRDAMRLALKWEDEDLPVRIEIDLPPRESDETYQQPGSRQLAMVPVFTVTLDENGEILSTALGGNITVSESALEEAISQVLNSGQTEGTLSHPRLRFLVDATPDSVQRIAFADWSWEVENLMSLAVTSLLMGIGALFCFFLVSLFLSNMALRPVEKAWEQQRQFVADASHELKTPLTVILANAGILLSHPEDTVAQQQKWITFIQDEAVQMRSLVEDLLFLARNDAARQPIQFASLSMSELTTSCALLFESVAFEAGITLESDIQPDLAIQGDEGQLRRLVMILLDNAVKYAGDHGKVTLTLSRLQEKLRLSVVNSGPPIPPEHLPHLFERFYRADSSRSREKGGYGLGLSIAQAIVQAHGGRITVTSSAQSGTCFTALLPITHRHRGRSTPSLPSKA